MYTNIFTLFKALNLSNATNLELSESFELGP